MNYSYKKTPITYRELKSELAHCFDNVDNSTMDNAVAVEDLDMIRGVLENFLETAIYLNDL